MVKVYKSGESFLEENLSYLLINKYASSLIVLNAQGMKETNKINYLLKCTCVDKNLIACRLSPFNVLLYGDYECLEELLGYINDNEFELTGIFCSSIIGEHLTNFKKVIGMDYMEASEISEESSNNVTHVSINDVDELANLSQEFFIECGLTDKVNRDKIIDNIDNYRVIKIDNKIVSMAKYVYNTESSYRISMVYTRKEYRGKGYAREVVNVIKNEIISQGKVATLNVDQDNPISNHLYASLGFKKVFSQCIYTK